MHPRRSVVRTFAVFALILCTTKTLLAQIVDPVTAAQAPVPGVGHHYIGVGSETVNPADGSLTFDLPIQVPAGRQLNVPFGIHFSFAALAAKVRSGVES